MRPINRRSSTRTATRGTRSESARKSESARTTPHTGTEGAAEEPVGNSTRRRPLMEPSCAVRSSTTVTSCPRGFLKFLASQVPDTASEPVGGPVACAVAGSGTESTRSARQAASQRVLGSVRISRPMARADINRRLTRRVIAAASSHSSAATTAEGDCLAHVVDRGRRAMTSGASLWCALELNGEPLIADGELRERLTPLCPGRCAEQSRAQVGRWRHLEPSGQLG